MTQLGRAGHVARRVLLVEDHEDSRKILMRLFEYEGFLATATDAGNAMEAACKGPFDLIIMGVGPTATPAAGLLHRLRGRLGDVPALAFSSVADSLDGLGFSIILMKPSGVDELMDAVGRLLSAPGVAQGSAR